MAKQIFRVELWDTARAVGNVVDALVVVAASVEQAMDEAILSWHSQGIDFTELRNNGYARWSVVSG